MKAGRIEGDRREADNEEKIAEELCRELAELEELISLFCCNFSVALAETASIQYVVPCAD